MDSYSHILSPGPVPQPSAAPSDNPPWNSDDERDFQDQEYSPPSPMSHYPGSLNQFVSFLSHILYWNSFDKSVLDHVLQELPVPIAGPSTQGISLQEAIRVSPSPPRIRYRIRYLGMSYDILYDIVYDIIDNHVLLHFNILYDIVYDIVYDISYEN